MPGLAAPTPAQVVPGQYITGALWNANVYNGLTFLANAPFFIGQQQVVQSVANGTWAVLTFDSEIIDTYGGHSTVSNTSRYTCQVAGWYRVGGRAAFATNGTGSRGARVHVNGAFIQGAANLLGAGTLNGIVEVSHLLQLAVGDYVEIAGGQNCGAALSTAFANEAASMMYVIWEHA
ncbi:hypothetical protein ACIA6C_28235 [Streptomyces sp. NPDC051578]|uniref:hypothetical protein n=1 Tax=Streptomyces sp. NPDC051578 TaxID=3365662 RepID=UPI00378D8F9B